MRTKIAMVVLAAVATATFTSVPAGAEHTTGKETCFGHLPHVISTKDRDSVNLGPGRYVAIIRGDYTRVGVAHAGSEPMAPYGNAPGALICVKKGADHVRVFGWVHKLHSGGQDTRLTYKPPCDTGRSDQFYRVYRIDTMPCDDEVLGTTQS